MIIVLTLVTIDDQESFRNFEAGNSQLGIYFVPIDIFRAIEEDPINELINWDKGPFVFHRTSKIMPQLDLNHRGKALQYALVGLDVTLHLMKASLKQSLEKLGEFLSRSLGDQVAVMEVEFSCDLRWIVFTQDVEQLEQPVLEGLDYCLKV